MKPTRSLRSFLIGSSILAASPHLHAAARYWDGSDTGANAQGGSGTWDTVTANWDSAATGGTDQTFATGPHQATFGGTAGTVTVSGTVVISGNSTTPGSGGLVFTTGGYSFNGTGTIQVGAGSYLHTIGTTTFGSGVKFDLAANLILSNGGIFNGEIKGVGNFSKAGGGTATVNYANTYTGVTTVTQGVLIAGTDSLSGVAGAFGNTSSDIVLGNAGANLEASILTGGAFTIGRIIRNATSNTTDAGTRVLTIGGNSAHNSTFSGNIFLGSTNNTSHGIVVTAASGGQVEFSGVIQNPTGQDGTEAASAAALTAVTKTGAGTVLLSGTNTYTGNALVNAGILNTSKALALPGYNSSGKVTVNGGTLGVRVGGAGWTNAEVNTLLTNATKTSGALGIDTTNGDFTQVTAYTPTNLGGLGLTKLGTNKLTLTQANTYTTATTVSAGALAVDGSLANSSTTVQTGASLQGSGTIGGSVTIQSGGTLAPGNSIESLGSGALSLQAGSTYAYELQTNLYAGTPNLSADLVFSSGTLDIAAGSILTLTDLATSTALVNGSKLTLISYFGGWTAGELFTYNATTLNDNSTFTLGANQWRFDYNDTTGGPNFTADQAGATSFVTMTVVPEPGVALLGSLGMLALLRRRRN